MITEFFRWVVNISPFFWLVYSAGHYFIVKDSFRKNAWFVMVLLWSVTCALILWKPM